MNEAAAFARKLSLTEIIYCDIFIVFFGEIPLGIFIC
jgi:hypothetical protein